MQLTWHMLRMLTQISRYTARGQLAFYKHLAPAPTPEAINELAAAKMRAMVSKDEAIAFQANPSAVPTKLLHE